jgi:UDP-N-acetylmuramoyl-L-alanyl-D-glutamate--2,6-diaminopimelate ligase
LELAGVKKNGATIYIDFAHKPDALEKVLITMREHISSDKDARLGVLFGCGGDRDKTKRPVMGKIANDLADFVIISDDNPRTEIAEVIRSEIAATCPKALNIGGREKAIKEAIKLLQPKDVLILAGKGHEKYTIIGKEIIPFDEFKIVRDCINME